MTAADAPDPRESVDRRPRLASRQRRVVLYALSEAPGFISAQELHARLLLDGQRVGLNTVYRALNAFADTGWVDVVRRSSGEQLFRLRPGPHHEHYLLCRTCGYNVAVTSEVVENWVTTVGEEHGFTDVDHVIELTGLCAECTARQQS